MSKSRSYDSVTNLKRTTCEHTQLLKQTGGLSSYASVQANLISCCIKSTRGLKLRLNRCFSCRITNGFLHSCLHCIYFACLKNGHMRNHYKETGHTLVCELAYGTIYCFKCGDFIYDRDFETIKLANDRSMERINWIPDTSQYSGFDWPTFLKKVKPTRNNNFLMAIVPNSTFGLRGFVNLGHTCFMNCIVQTLIHTPLLRDFFLSQRIVCSQKHGRDETKPCIITSLFELFHEFYDGNRTAMSLHGLLHKIWENASHLAGYEQQDAHEFFFAMLEALHSHFAVPDAKTCKCVVDTIFHGRLQSAVTCTVCSQQSITVDPFWDISLDIKGDNADPKAAIDLKECLQRYTRVEHLGSGGMIRCEICDKNQVSTKQLTFKFLPVILCLHLKRFEHSTNTKKIDNRVKFPETLDLSPFTCGRDESNWNEPCSEMESELLKKANPRDNKRYSLYAVVNHIGNFDGGHYYAFIRHVRMDWFKCDDHVITKASREEVLDSPGYLLFYHKETLHYDDSPGTAKNAYRSFSHI